MVKDISKPSLGYELHTGTSVFVLKTIEDKINGYEKNIKIAILKITFNTTQLHGASG